MKKTLALIICIKIMVFMISCGGDSTTFLDSNGDSNGQGDTILSGKVVDYYGEGISGALVTIDGSTTDTDSQGQYIFTDINNGSYELIVTRDGYTFLPESKDITASGSDVSVMDFIGSTSGFGGGGHNGDRGYCAQCH